MSRSWKRTISRLTICWSDDHPDSSSGTVIPMRWSTPVTEYRDIGDRDLMDRGATVYLRPDGPFTYGEFTSRSIQYDLRDPDED